MNRICNQDVGTRECVKVRESARTHSDELLTWMQVLSVGTPVALAKKTWLIVNADWAACNYSGVTYERIYSVNWLYYYCRRQIQSDISEHSSQAYRGLSRQGQIQICQIA